MSPQPDLILTNGLITTMAERDDLPAEVSALAIRDGRVAEIGDSAQIRALAGPETEEIDLAGARVIPGLIDSHVHFIRAGRTWNDEVRWEDAYSLTAALQLIADRAAELPPGRWIRVIGGWDERQFAEGRGPTRADLDRVAPEHPVYVQMQYTHAVLNSAGWAELGLDEAKIADSPDPSGFERDADGTPTGKGSGMKLMTWFYRQLPPPSFTEQVASTAALSTEFARLGLTGAIDGGGVNTGPDAYGAIYETWRRGELKTRVRLFKHATKEGTEEEDFAGYLRFESPRFGDDILRMSGIGEILMYRSHDRIATPADYGPEAMEQTRELLTRCAANGWTVQVHVHQREFFLKLLDLMEEIDRIHPLQHLRWGFVHAESTYREDVERLQAVGAGLLLQSLFRLNGEYAIEAWGAERIARSPELRDLTDAGVPIGFGSDAMRVASYNPFASMQWFCTGLSISGTPTLQAPHLLDRHEILRGYTTGGAWFTFEEDQRGRLVPGQWADLAVLTEDYFEVPVERMHLLESDLTLLGGEVVWDSGRHGVPAS